MKEESIRIARHVLAGRWGDVVVLDTETTGIDTGAEIIEFAAYDIRKGRMMSSLFRPVSNVPPNVEELTGITQKMLVDEKPVRDYELQIKNMLGGKVWVGYNVAFDLRILHQTFLIHGIKFPPIPLVMVDVMLLASNVIQVYNSIGEYKWWKLAEACDRLGVIPESEYHRAMADVVATLNLLRAIADLEIEGDHTKDMTNVTTQKSEDTLYL